MHKGGASKQRGGYSVAYGNDVPVCCRVANTSPESIRPLAFIIFTEVRCVGILSSLLPDQERIAGINQTAPVHIADEHAHRNGDITVICTI
jgi:hypothetical protein